MLRTMRLSACPPILRLPLQIHRLNPLTLHKAMRVSAANCHSCAFAAGCEVKSAVNPNEVHQRLVEHPAAPPIQLWPRTSAGIVESCPICKMWWCCGISRVVANETVGVSDVFGASTTCIANNLCPIPSNSTHYTQAVDARRRQQYQHLHS